jgi:hypothetical protein
MPELPDAQGLAQVAGKVNLAGLWAWVRGGGWRGPYVNAANETWIDANVFAVPMLAADPRAELATIAHRWITQRLDVTGPAEVDALSTILAESPQTALQMFYIGPYAKGRAGAWHPSANFIQDDQVDADAAWAIIQRLSEAQLDEVVAEKQAAEHRMSEHARLLGHIANRLQHPVRESLPLSLQYGSTLIQTLRSLITGLVGYRRWVRKHDPAVGQAAEKAMRISQSCWVHHTQRIATHGGASPFGSDNLWDVTQRVIEDLHDQAS